MRGGGSQPRMCAQRSIFIHAQKPRNKTLFCIDQWMWREALHHNRVNPSRQASCDYGWVSLYKISFHFKSVLFESIIRLVPPPICKAYPITILLHDGLTPPLRGYQDRVGADQPRATLGEAQRMWREALQHNSPRSRDQASCGSVHGSVARSNWHTRVGETTRNYPVVYRRGVGRWVGRLGLTPTYSLTHTHTHTYIYIYIYIYMYIYIYIYIYILIYIYI